MPPGPHKPEHATATGTITTGPGVLYEAHLAGGSANSTVTLYDNTSAAGTIICRLAAPLNGPGDRFAPEGGVAFSKGLHAVIGGTGATLDVAYDGGD